MSLERQRVVVLGGTSGIGLASAAAALEQGAEVLVGGRDEQRLSEALERLGDGAEGASVDATDRGSLERFLTDAGAFEHLVLALGGGAGGGPIASLELGELRAGFDGKLFPHVSALQLALPHIQPAGSIVFVSATSAGAPFAGAAGLAAINGALEAMVPALAVELAPIRVNAGTVLTVDGGLRFRAAA
jgi:NAD(P)-dependent dehydrogenase (short-subunit alcohol dehydrogenase family)